jgi:hypothetical protein
VMSPEDLLRYSGAIKPVISCFNNIIANISKHDFFLKSICPTTDPSSYQVFVYGICEFDSVQHWPTS